MSQENVEILRRSTAAFNRGDRATAFADYHPDIEYRDLQHAPDSPERFHSRAALEAYWAQWEEAFDELSVEIEEYVDAGDCVVTVTHWRGSGKDTAIQVDVTGAGVW